MSKYSELEDIFNKLKSELSVRETNAHVGCGMGGDPSQLFFLMSRKEVWLQYNNDTVCVIPWGDDKLTINIPHYMLQGEINVRDLRNCLNTLCSHFPIEKVTFEQLTNLSWLKDCPNQTQDIKLLIKSLECVNALSLRLKSKEAALESIRGSFSFERKAIEKLFLQEMGLPVDALEWKEEEDLKEGMPTIHCLNKEVDRLNKILEQHPVWGSKLEAINKRARAAERVLFSEEDENAIKLIDSLPDFVKISSYRTIGLDVIVNFNLDELGMSMTIM